MISIMSRKTIWSKVDGLGTDMKNLTVKLEKHLTEFDIYKKFITRVGWAILVGVGGILIKLFWTYIVKSPSVIAHVIFNGTMG